MFAQPAFRRNMLAPFIPLFPGAPRCILATWLTAFAVFLPHALRAQIGPVGERVQFDSPARGKAERIWGYLSFPKQITGKVPLMMILHSSGGIRRRDWQFARTLNEMGVATFVLDSFGPRELKKVDENKLSFGEREQLIDALSALQVLLRDRRMDVSRLASMGRSLGGETSLRLIMKASRDRLPIKGPKIVLAIAITPACMAQERDTRLTPGSEAHLFLAEKDFSPYRQCVSYAERIRKTGGRIDYKVFPDTHHVFDGSESPVWTPNQEVYAKCPIERFGPGRLIRGDTGEELKTEKARKDFFAACVTRGAWVGGSPSATRELDRDWTAIVRARLMTR